MTAVLLPWLAAAFLWSGVAIGSLGWIMVIRLTGGRWGHATLPFLEAGALTLPLAAATFVPVLLGLAWLDPGASGRLTGFKGLWLSPLPLVLRTVLLFAGAALIARALIGRRGPALPVSSAGLLFLMPVMTIVAVDWLLAPDPTFHSSGFGLQAIAIQFSVAWLVAVLFLLARQPERTEAVGAVTIAMILLSLYLAFTAYVIIWSGNLRPLVGWWVARGSGGWTLANALVALVEIAAFLLLLLERTRKSGAALRAIAAALLAAKALECAWIVLPYAGPVRLAPLLLFLLFAGAIGVATAWLQARMLQQRLARRTPA